MTAGSASFSEPGRKGIAVLAASLLLIAAACYCVRSQIWTGDEPRYVMYASSIIEHGRPVMTMQEWSDFVLRVTGSRSATLPVGGDGTVLMNSLYLPVLLSPIAYLWPLGGLRFATLIVGLIGLASLARLCGRLGGERVAVLGVVVAGLSIPLLPYLHLFYMETYLFALVCVSWERLHRVETGWLADGMTALLVLAIPFVHLRGSVVAVLLFAMLVWQTFRRGLYRRTLVLSCAAAVAFGSLLVANWWIYGTITGPVNTARPPTPSQSFDVLTMQLFNVRHGLLAYAPVWLLGYAGLWLALQRRSRIGIEGLVLATVAAVTSIGINPGECWPARFWVLSMPMLTVGLCVWWTTTTTVLPRLIGIALLGFTFVNTLVFLVHPNLYLENRQSPATYQYLFDVIGKLHFGLPLPVEVDDADNLTVARNLSLGASVFLLSMLLAAWRRNGLFALPAAAMLLIVVDLCRVSVVAAPGFDVRLEPARLVVTPGRPIKSGYLQLGNDWETWFVPPDFDHFTVAYSSGDGTHRTALSANQVISFSCNRDLQDVAVSSSPGFGLVARVENRVRLYEARSAIRQFVASRIEGCGPAGLDFALRD